MTNKTLHSVIHTGGNVYNDYISDFDNSGRVIIVSESLISLYANDRDYQLSLDPIATASSPNLPYEARCPDCGEEHCYDEIGMDCKVCVRGIVQRGDLEPITDDSQVAGIESTTDYVVVQDVCGAVLTVWRDNSA